MHTVRRKTAYKCDGLEQQLMNAVRSGEWLSGPSPTERELAQEYGVSRTTVRRVLASLENKGIISIDKGWRNSIKNSGAQRLRFLWLSLNSMNNEPPVRMRLYDRLVKYAETRSASLSYWRISGDSGDKWLQEHLHEYDGIVVSNVSSDCMMPELAARIAEYPNTVAVQKLSGKPAAVTCTTDDYHAGYKAAEYLHGKGLERIGLLAVSPGLRDRHFHDRVKGFCDYCLDHTDNIQEYPLFVSGNYEDFRNPERIIAKVKPLERRLQALFVLSDNLALRIMEVLQKTGVRVPRDISILGCDDLPEGVEAALTTISHPVDDLADYVWQKLIKNTGAKIKPQPEEKIFPAMIIERSTVIT